MSWTSYIETEQHRFVQELIEFVRIPSVSAKRENAKDVQRAAEWVVRRMLQAGINHPRVLPTNGHPVVYGDWLEAGPEKPTVLIYGHFDVQPAEPFELWKSPPFDPEIRDGKLWGRGTSDDKAGMLTPILATEAMLRTAGNLPINVKFLFEAEEEIGSASLRAFVESNVELLRADMIFSSDGTQWSPDQPQIMQAMKGTLPVDIIVKGPAQDLHSGFHGGGVANPAMALAQILASLKSSDGRITIDGFYDDVETLGSDERAEIGRIPFNEPAYLALTGSTETHGEPGYSVPERIGSRPMLDVNGLTSGWQGEGSKTVLPSEARAKMTFRLVRGQSARRVGELFKRHVEQHCPTGVSARVEIPMRESRAFAIPDGHEASSVAADTLKEVYGRSPYKIWAGGAIPAFLPFLDILGVYPVMLGFSHSDENLHAPNEFVRLRAFERGQIVYGRLFEKLSERALMLARD